MSLIGVNLFDCFPSEISFIILHYVDDASKVALNYSCKSIQLFLSSHSCKLPQKREFVSVAISEGWVELVRWGIEMNCYFEKNVEAYYDAARGGHLLMLKWLHENECPWDEGARPMLLQEVILKC